MQAKSLKKELKQLKILKGIASKNVGIAKKNSQPTDELIKKVQNFSAQIKTIEDQLKVTLERSKKHLPDAPFNTPPQFLKRSFTSKKDTPVKIVSNISDEQWDTYVNNHPNATMYHTSAIRRVIKETFGHPDHYLSAVDDDQNIQAVLPLIEMKSRLFGHFFISVPFFNYGGLLSSNLSAEKQLIDYASNLTEKTGAEHIEYRHTSNFLDLPSKSEKVAMLLTLPESIDTLWSNIGSKVRAQVKKAQRYETETRIGDEELINDFYNVFSRNMRDLGTPVYSKSLFFNMMKNCPSAKIICVYHNNKPVSVGFLVGWRNTLEIPWASTLRKANKLDTNMMLYWEVLKYAIQNQFKVFDFGRSSKDSNTYRFKKQWGASAHKLYWHYCLQKNSELPQINPNNPKFKLIVESWKRLPLGISNIIGPHIVKSIP